MKIAWDLDGVLCDIDLGLIRVIDNMTNPEAKYSAREWYFRERKPLLDARLFLSPDDEFYIITSRSHEFLDITKKWVRYYYPNAKLITINQKMMDCNQNDTESIKKYVNSKIKLKAEIINKLGIDVYFEDDGVKLFRELCPNCAIIKYGGRLEVND